MFSLFMRAGLVTLISIVSSIFAALILLPILGETIDASVYVLGTGLPVIIAFPISFFVFRKSDRFKQLSEELAEAYKTLADLHARLSETARMDGLTGLLNRDAFMKHFVDGPNDNHEGALLIIDADHFKTINDKFGHAAGDVALVAIAKAISSTVRRHDLVGRLGGEEFGVFLKSAKQHDATVISERIRAAVQAISFKPNEKAKYTLTVSIGGAYLSPNVAFEKTMATADMRLYHAKNEGRNCVVLKVA
jgi:diguanylate cyclase (GGDEF)-like protein